MRIFQLKAFIVLNMLLFGVVPINSQNPTKLIENPSFDSFTGTVYAMPLIIKDHGTYRTKSIQEKFGQNIFNYRSIGEIKLEEINIQETTIGQGYFPGVEKTTQFCMILFSKMEIHEEACYEFELHSDDGSILWINQEEIVNNDGGHQMKSIKDTIELKKGIYDIRLWYFQGLPDRFGFKMNSRIITDTQGCSKLNESMELQSNFLFETGAYTLSGAAYDSLNILVQSYNLEAYKSIEIIGHTDNVGLEKDNLELSQNRANSVAQAFRSLIGEKPLEIIATGMGESDPKTSNDTEAGREMNRRVQIIIR